MTTIKIAGVPEHFNYPWHLAINNQDFENQNINLQWTNVPEGTGKLCQMLRDNETDIAIILTEGIMKDIAAGNPSKIVQKYIQTPLLWGIYINANSKYTTINELQNKKAAISRIGSGSQLMTYVNANNQGWDYNQVSYQVVNTIDGAVEALQNKQADYFMWEQFMTKPLVDKGVFNKIGICPTPWPSFVIAVQNTMLQEKAALVKKVLSIINQTTAEFKEIPSIENSLSAAYNLKKEDVVEWLSVTNWAQKNFTKLEFNTIQQQLLQYNITNTTQNFEDVVHIVS
jgi:ABC-type nitrate/sulfonate/bicarbonate transport system substrate-binding protein